MVILMENPKFLPPTLRERERYLVFEIISESAVEYKDLSRAMWFSILAFLGETGAAESQARIIKNLYNPKKQQGIIRCKHDMTEKVRASIAMVRKIGNTNSIIRVLGITGTIKSAKNKYLGYTDLRILKEE